MPLLDERAHKAEEERQQQRADVAAVDVGIGHEDDLAVAQLRHVEIRANARAERRDHRHELFVAVDLVEARFLHVEHLAPQRKDRLIPPVAPADGRAACRVTLDDVNFRMRRVALLTVGQLAGQGRALQRCLPARGLPRAARRFPRARGHQRLVEDGARHRRVLLQKGLELVVHHRLDQRAHVGVAELRLRLALELRVRQLDGNDRAKPLARVVAGDLLLALEDVVFFAVVVEHLRQRGLEARLVRAALGCVNIIRKG